ncbi:MAG: secD [Gammaproteobacteria bacterium]|jgi:preprotein translocase subunit SecD|nr:secD [Gammaproteobacteria bacterium]
MNRYPAWKYLLVIVVLLFGIVYSLPNLYTKDYAVQVSADSAHSLDANTLNTLRAALANHQIEYSQVEKIANDSVLYHFANADTQLRADDVIKDALGTGYTVALNMAATTPKWLQAIGAQAVPLGLDLSGGVHFLMAIDINSLVTHRMQAAERNIADTLRKNGVRYLGLQDNQDGIRIRAADRATADKIAAILSQDYPEFTQSLTPDGPQWLVQANLSEQARADAQNFAVDKTISVLRKRIDELGVNEPIVQRQGADRISVDLPGVQDTARAKQIIGGTATLEFHLQDVQHDAAQAKESGLIPPGTSLYPYTPAGTTEAIPILLQDQIVLSGSSITNATATVAEDGRPAVSITLGGGGEAAFYRITGENVGKPLAIVYVETVLTPVVVKGEMQYTQRKSERVISSATIQSALPSTFQITGLSDVKESRDLSLLLRAGSLPTPVAIIEESTLGPSLGAQNIHKGIFSIEVGFIAIVLFMILYYRFFGLLADIALGMNLVLLVAVLSVLGATLSLPGIAGILLTLGMAVDANVLIFERIREELRNGVSPQASIQAGYERAFATIVDSNVTTLIAAMALLMIGTGAVKGFAVTLTIGILTSMFTAITGTRAIVNLIYGHKVRLTKLSIGI